MNRILTFKAAVASIYTEYDVLVVAFADSTEAEPENYLILQQFSPCAENENDYWFEINAPSISGYGGFQQIYLDKGNLVIVFTEALAKQHSYAQLKIVDVESACDVEALRTALHAVFDNTGCPFDETGI
jgi:hypothetical protein